MKIGIIGLGNMANAMISGMLSKKMVAPEDILGADKSEKARSARKEQYGINVSENNRDAATFGDILIFAVKPQFLQEVLDELKGQIPMETLIISIVAGRTIAYYEQQLGDRIKLVRCMPNTPALVGEGCSGVCRNKNITNEDMYSCLEVLKSFGWAEEMKESLIDAVVGVSGSAPAYVFMFIEAMADEAVEQGMPRDMAYRFAARAVMGSAKLMVETGKHPGELKDMVCSPAGTTIAAVKVLEECGFRGAVMDAVEAASEKSRNL